MQGFSFIVGRGWCFNALVARPLNRCPPITNDTTAKFILNPVEGRDGVGRGEGIHDAPDAHQPSDEANLVASEKEREGGAGGEFGCELDYSHKVWFTGGGQRDREWGGVAIFLVSGTPNDV